MALVEGDSLASGGKEAGSAGFFIDLYEVTNGEYQEFLGLSGYVPAEQEAFLAHLDERVGHQQEASHNGCDEFPVRFVSYEDAEAYARFYGKSLPTRELWLTAAVGDPQAGKLYPWRGEFISFFCNSLRSKINGPARVGTFENGKSLWGCYDMVGNVAEWTATPVPDEIEPSYYIMGGSWSNGGNPQEERKAFDLSRPRGRMDYTERGSRSSVLGFRCVIADALSFIRDELTSRMGALSPDERKKAADELSPINDELYSVLKRLQFDSDVDCMVDAGDSPSLATPLAFDDSGAGSRFVLCYDTGEIGLYSLTEGCLKTENSDAADAPFRYELFGCNGEKSSVIVMSSVWNSLLKVIDTGDAREMWSVRGPGQALDILPVSGSGEDTVSHLLVLWHTDDRAVNHLLRTESPFPKIDDLYRRIRFYASFMLPGDGMKPSETMDRLSLFTLTPDVINLEEEDLFRVTNLGHAGLLFGNDMDKRFSIQLHEGGGFWFLQKAPLPGSRLRLYDIENGSLEWSLDFPEAFFNFDGVVTQKPVLLGRKSGIAVVLEEGGMSSSGQADSTVSRVCCLDTMSGSCRGLIDLDMESVRLSDLAPISSRPDCFLGIMNSKDLLCFDTRGNETYGMSVQRISLVEMLGSVEEVVAIDAAEEPTGVDDLHSMLPWSAQKAESGRELPAGPREEPPPLGNLWTFSSPVSPWLVTKPDRNGKTLLFSDFKDGWFRKASLLKGVFNRLAHLSENGYSNDNGYLLLWGSSGRLLCFDAETGCFLWEMEMGNIADIDPTVSDFDGNGSLEALISSTSGELRVVELDTGRIETYIMKAGFGFTCHIPLYAGAGSSNKILLGVKDEGLFLLDPLKPPGSRHEKDMSLTIAVLEEWRCRQAAQ